jgi:hypothetical protein
VILAVQPGGRDEKLELGLENSGLPQESKGNDAMIFMADIVEIGLPVKEKTWRMP